jgi:hypothetical protein
MLHIDFMNHLARKRIVGERLQRGFKRQPSANQETELTVAHDGICTGVKCGLYELENTQSLANNLNFT